jgi:hypothetical protein
MNRLGEVTSARQAGELLECSTIITDCLFYFEWLHKSGMTSEEAKEYIEVLSIHKASAEYWYRMYLTPNGHHSRNYTHWHTECTKDLVKLHNVLDVALKRRRDETMRQ